jgi:DNA-binding PadR family transcriptional regulator
MQVLWMLKKPLHGYGLMKSLNTLKRTKITQGTLYPTLQRLEELKLIESRTKGRKKIYHLTKKGKSTMKNSCLEFCRTFHGIFEDYVCGKCR